MYNPPVCNGINFALSGIYTPPICSAINFSFVATEDYVFSSDYSEIKIQTSSDDVFFGIYFSQDDSEIITQSSEQDVEIVTEFEKFTDEVLIQTVALNIGKPNLYDLPTGISGGINFSWKTPEKINVHKKISWDTPEHIIKIINSPFIEPKKEDSSTSMSWKSMDKIDIKSDIAFDELQEFDIQCDIPFATMDIFDIHVRKAWANGEKKDHSSKVVYKQPAPNDTLKTIVYDSFDNLDKSINVFYKSPPPVDKSESIPWGPFSYYTLCNGLTYYPPKGCDMNFHFPNKYQLLSGVCQGIVFNINAYSTDPRCHYDHWHSGIRDSGNGIIPTHPIEYPKPKKNYYMFNQILVQEVVTQTPIEILSVDIKIDINSWLWSFSITVASECYLALIKPINGVMGHLKITINSYDWYCAVEGWSESRTFGSQSWTITGRSPAMMFGDPISQKMSGSVTTAKQGQNIIEDIVQNKQLPPFWPSDFQSWTADLSIYNTVGSVVTGFKPFLNWYIPENTVNYTEKTEIEILKELSGSIGAYIQAHRSENKLIFKPLYPHQPWHWEIQNTDIAWRTINESQIKEIGRSNSLKPFYQAVNVVGESIGGSNLGDGADGSNTAIFVDVRRQEFGPSTASYAPMITNPYVTSSKAALELGRVQIAQTGEWLNHTLRLSILCPNNSSFGLYEVGDMISVLERGLSWRGQVTGVNIVAASSGGGYGVQQTINVQEYKGE